MRKGRFFSKGLASILAVLLIINSSNYPLSLEANATEDKLSKAVSNGNVVSSGDILDSSKDNPMGSKEAVSAGDVEVLGEAATLGLGFTRSKENVKPGDIVDVKVSLLNYANEDVKDIIGLQVSVKLNTNVVQFHTITNDKGVEVQVYEKLAKANEGDISSCGLLNGDEIKYMYASVNDFKDPFPRSNVDLFSFSVKVRDDITKDVTAIFSCDELLVTTDVNTVIPITNSPSINVLVENPTILLNNAAPSQSAYNNSVTIGFNKGTATLTKDGGTPISIANGDKVDANGSYSVTATDALGNTSTTKFTVDLAVKAIQMKTYPDLEYIIETNFDPAGGEIEVTYVNDTKAIIPLTAAMCDVEEVGDVPVEAKTVTVTYKEQTTTFPIKVVNKEVTSISMLTPPTKTVYIEGQDLDPTGASINVVYNNGTTDTVTVTEQMLDGYQKNKIGKQTISVTYEEEFTTEFEVEVKAKSIVSITATKPTNTEYIEGQAFDATGMQVTANFDNGTSETVTDYTVTPQKLSLGTTEVTVTYQGKTATIPVTVKAKTLDKIEVTTNPTLSFKVNTAFNTNGGKLTLTYDNGDEEVLDLTLAMCPILPDMTTLGEQVITVKYEGKETSYKINVLEKELISISIKTSPDKLIFIEGNEFVTNGEITLHYDNDTESSKPITAAMCSGYDMNKVGKQTVIVTERGVTTEYTTEYEITVNAKSVTEISIASKPENLAYIEGQQLDLTGATLKVEYDNGTSAVEAITAGMISGYAPATIGTQKVTVTYQRKTTSFDVTVRAKILIGIEVTTNPTLSFKVNTAFNTNGGKLTLTYDNGDKVVSDIAEDMCTIPDMTTLGEQVITVRYGEMQTSYKINVLEKELISISIKTSPDKLIFIEGNEFVTNGEITLHYDNGTESSKPITAAMCSGYDMNKVGKQTVIVTERGITTEYTTEYEITVNAKSVTAISVETQPQKLAYIEGQQLVLTGGTIKVEYDNGTSAVEAITAGMISGYAPATIGSQKVTVTYQGKTTTFDVTVRAKELTGISLDVAKDVKSILEDRSLKLSGIWIIAAYDNDTTEKIAATADMISQYDASLVGKQQVKVTYKDRSDTFEVEVISKKAVDEVNKSIKELDINKLTIADEAKVMDIKKQYDALSALEKAAVVDLDKLNKAIDRIEVLRYPEIEKPFLDEAIKIEAEQGVVPYNASLNVVEAKAPDKALDSIKSKFGGKSSFVASFDITLVDVSGKPIQPNGTVVITIKLPEVYRNNTNLVAVYIDDQGNVTELASSLKDGYISFETGHFSQYAVVEKLASPTPSSNNNTGGNTETKKESNSTNEATSDTSPKTSDSGLSWMWPLCIGVFMLDVLFIFIYRMRKYRR